jgi:hypothetical protein
VAVQNPYGKTDMFLHQTLFSLFRYLFTLSGNAAIISWRYENEPTTVGVTRTRYVPCHDLTAGQPFTTEQTSGSQLLTETSSSLHDTNIYGIPRRILPSRKLS